MTSRVLITGGFGYLGGRIAGELQREPGFMVRLGSRQQRRPPDWLPEAETVAMDVLDAETLPSAVEGVEAVVHLAAMNENECVADPGRAVLVNTLGTLHVLQAAIDAGVERFIYFSTAHVYGSPLVGDITEETLPTPIHPYALTHHGAEAFVLAAHRQARITGIVIRLSNGFGAPTHPAVDRWTLLVNDLCRQVAQTRRMVLRSTGVEQRDFITLSNVGRAARHLIDLPRSESGNGLFNLGSGTSVSVWEMVQRIAARSQLIFHSYPEITRPQPAKGETGPSLVYSNTKLKETGFALLCDADAEIDETLRLCLRSF